MQRLNKNVVITDSSHHNNENIKKFLLWKKRLRGRGQNALRPGHAGREDPRLRPELQARPVHRAHEEGLERHHPQLRLVGGPKESTLTRRSGRR